MSTKVSIAVVSVLVFLILLAVGGWLQSRVQQAVEKVVVPESPEVKALLDELQSMDEPLKSNGKGQRKSEWNWSGFLSGRSYRTISIDERWRSWTRLMIS